MEDFIPYLDSSELTLSQTFHKPDSKEGPLLNWAIVDEILHNKSIDGHPIDPKLLSIFDSNKSIYRLVKRDDEPTEMPRMLYPCSSQETPLDDKNTSLSTVSKSNNAEYGRIYVFSEKPKTKTKRFVVFPTFHYTENGLEFFGVLSYDKFREF